MADTEEQKRYVVRILNDYDEEQTDNTLNMISKGQLGKFMGNY